jgi:hypothetical protein
LAKKPPPSRSGHLVDTSNRGSRVNAQKIASQAGRTLLTLKAHKYFSCEVDAAGLLCWARKEGVIAAERAHDGWSLLHTNLLGEEATPAQVQGHDKNRLEVEEAFCELKSDLRVRPVFHWRPDRVSNHVRLCFIAYWISARARHAVARLRRARRSDQAAARAPDHPARPVPVRSGRGSPERPPDRSASSTQRTLEKLRLLHLFAAPPKWALPRPS